MSSIEKVYNVIGDFIIFFCILNACQCTQRISKNIERVISVVCILVLLSHLLVGLLS